MNTIYHIRQTELRRATLAVAIRAHLVAAVLAGLLLALIWGNL